MSRPTSIRFDSDEPAWRSVPMPASNLQFELRRLESSGHSFVIHGRFPAGFERNQPGGYAVPEEFIVLDGDLTLEGVSFRRGEMVYVPANFRRTSMTSVHGCEVIAWFGGPATFIHEAEFDDSVEDGMQSVALYNIPAGEVLELPHAKWVKASAEAPQFVEVGDVIDGGLLTWRRAAAELFAEDNLLRIEALG